MTSESDNQSVDDCEEPEEGDPREDNDGRELFTPESKWPDEVRAKQTTEAIYIVVMLFLSLCLLAIFGLATGVISGTKCVSLFGFVLPEMAVKYGLLGAGGLLGGTIYGAKWLYHGVARGLWHEDRRLWRFMQPWISLGTTIGIWALINSGFFRTAPQDISMLGLGFVIGYLSDQFLAKMKEITNVLFGRTERHFEKQD